MQSQVYAERSDVETRLAALDLSAQELRDALQQGFAGWATCTENSPRCLPGFLLWGDTVTALRQSTALRGWARSDRHNQPITVHPTGRFAVTVATGTAGTGLPDQNPTTASPKGPFTIRAVETNQLAFPFYEDIRRTGEVEDRETWLLLVHCDARNSVVRAELSLPVDVDDRGFVCRWSQRILLDPVEFDSSTVRFAEVEDHDSEFDIPVSRRAVE